ncbi:MAG: NAD(P)-binding protein, partial [Candidatus Baltobacteraceae bacterium]
MARTAWFILPQTARRQRKSCTACAGARRRRSDVLIAGAGYAGSVMAERFARDAGKRVLLIDRRSHIGGNAYDCRNEDGILIHRYGPHIFHTNSQEVFAYLSRFTKWRPYEH